MIAHQRGFSLFFSTDNVATTTELHFEFHKLHLSIKHH